MSTDEENTTHANLLTKVKTEFLESSSETAEENNLHLQRNHRPPLICHIIMFSESSSWLVLPFLLLYLLEPYRRKTGIYIARLCQLVGVNQFTRRRHTHTHTRCWPKAPRSSNSSSLSLACDPEAEGQHPRVPSGRVEQTPPPPPYEPSNHKHFPSWLPSLRCSMKDPLEFEKWASSFIKHAINEVHRQEVKTRPFSLNAVFVLVNTKKANQFIEQRRSNTAMIADATPINLIVTDLYVVFTDQTAK